MAKVTDNWSLYVYEFEGAFYECGSQRYIMCLDTEKKDNIFKMWINFMINDGEKITFNTLLDLAQFIQDEEGTYKDFMGEITLDNLF